jgi:hypothetical protein
MKNWLDKYDDGGPVQPNYNDASVSMSKDFVGDGYSNVGRNYSPAWGGQFQSGGYLSPEQYNKKHPPIYVSNPKDSRIGQYAPAGNQYLYKKPIQPIVKKLKPTPQSTIDWIEGNGYSEEYVPNVEQPINANPFGFIEDPQTGYGHRYRTTTGELEYPFRGGQTHIKPKMAMGGSMPGAVGHMYSRQGSGTAQPGDADYNAPRTGDIPSNGPYAKKTMASAQNGMEMKYYQEGLDWKPKSMKKGGETPKMSKTAIARNERIAKADAAAKQPFSAETIATRASAFPDRALFSEALEDSFPRIANWIDNNPVASYIDQNLNPSVVAGKIMSNYGHIPLNIKQGNYEQAVMNALSPLALISGAPSTKNLLDLNKKKLNGPSVANRYKQGGQLVKLDQLTNFTNYNTKQPGENWLDKYQ